MRDVQPSEVRPRPARVVVSTGFLMCSDLVTLIPEGWGGPCTWLAAPNADARNSKLECGGSSRNGGRTARNLELVEANREATPTARRIFGADERELLWIPRAYHGPDEVRAPPEKRASAEYPARRLVRGSRPSPDSANSWPGEKAASRGAPAKDASEPQAELSGENPPELLSFAARFANGHAATRQARPSRGVAPPGSFQEIEAGRGPSSPAPPPYPLAGPEKSPSELACAWAYVKNAA